MPDHCLKRTSVNLVRTVLLTAVAFFFIGVFPSRAQEAKLALTPPMGWNGWNHF